MPGRRGPIPNLTGEIGQLIFTRVTIEKPPSCPDKLLITVIQPHINYRQNVSNNTRLLIFPWVRIVHLGSHVLGQLARRVRADWQERWGYGPLLMESFVDPEKFLGTCYRAAGWIELGRTTGRGLQRGGPVYESTPKRIYVRALAEDFGERLCGGPLQGRVEE